MNSQKIIVLGAGAAGMMSAITAARNKSHVIILEHTDRCGKKLLSTGNGRCNLTNLEQSELFYRCSCKEFPRHILKQFTQEQTLKQFQQLGLYTKSRNGYVYPYSEQAGTVLDILKMELERLDISIIYNIKVDKICKTNKIIQIKTNMGDYLCDKVIIATGSKAAPKTGSDGSGYEIAKKLGHRIIKPLPALVQLRCAGDYFKAVTGVRCEVGLSLLINGKEAISDKGELQLTDYGISGIPTFQISRYAVKALDEGKKVIAQIDFMPDLEYEEFKELIKRQMEWFPEKSLEQILIGFLNKKLVPVMIKKAGLANKIVVKKITDKQLDVLLDWIKSFLTEVVSYNSFDQAQVCMGGVDTREISKETLESLRVAGVYFAGEIMDVDGICGGYNLQWAWSSGYVAGQNASKG